MDEGLKPADSETISYKEASSHAKAAIVDLPASPGHVKVFDILTKLEEARPEDAEELLSRLSGAITGVPKLKELVSAQFGAILADTLAPVDEQGTMERILRLHKAIDLEDLERQSVRMVNELERVTDEMGRLRRRADVAVRLSNIFAFVAIVLALLLLISGVAADYVSFDWSSVQPDAAPEESQ